jgi:hypothetical protein
MVEGEGAIPEPVRRLLDRLDSIAQLELLLLLHRTAPDEWTAPDLARELRIDASWAASKLDRLAQRGLAAGDGSGRYAFAPATPELGKAVEALAACYAEHRVTLVALLYAQPHERIRVFADSFRIRKEEDDG